MDLLQYLETISRKSVAFSPVVRAQSKRRLVTRGWLLAICCLAWFGLFMQSAAAQTVITDNDPCFASRPLTTAQGDNQGITSQPVLNVNGNWVAYWSTDDLVAGGNADGNIEIFVQQTPAENDYRQITTSNGSILGGFNLDPSISDDGTLVAFYSDRDLVQGQNVDGNFEIFLARRTGADTYEVSQVTITNGSANLFPSLSRDGTSIAFVSDDSDLHTVDESRSNPDRNFEVIRATLTDPKIFRQVTNTPAVVTNDAPSINGDGSRVAFAAGSGGDSQIFLWDENGGEPEQLTTSGTNEAPALNATGTAIAYISSLNDNQSQVVLHSFSADGTESRSEVIVPPASNTVYRNPSISNNGERIAYVADTSDANTIVVSLNLFDTTTGVSALIPVPGGGTGEQPAISGDGSKIAFISVANVNDNPDATGSVALLSECPLADLVLTTVGAIPTNVLAGVDLIYRFQVENRGPSIVQDVQVVYDIGNLPALPRFVSPSVALSSDGCELVGNRMVCSLGEMVVGETKPLQIGWDIAPNAELRNIVSEFTVSANAIDPRPADNGTGRLTTRVTEVADLGISKHAISDTIQAGLAQPFTYTVAFTNTGPSATRDGRLTDTLPANVVFLTATVRSTTAESAVCEETINNRQVVCIFGIIPFDNQSTLVDIVVRATPAAGAVLVNQAEISSTTDDLNQTNNSVQLETAVFRPADMQVTKSAAPAPTVVAGTDVTYTLQVRNLGTANAVGVVVSDVLPVGITFSRAITGTPCIGQQSGTVVRCDVGAMAAGSQRTLVFVSRVSASQAAAPVQNRATVVSARFDPAPGNNTSPTVVSQIIRVSDLHVVKTVDNASPTEGDTIVYTVVVANRGPSQAAAVVVDDNSPSGLTYVSDNPSQGTFSDATGRWSVGELAPGASATLRVTYRVNQVNSGTAQVQNSVAASSSSTDDDRFNGANSDSVTIPINDRPRVLGVPASFKLNEDTVQTVTGLSVDDRNPADTTLRVIFQLTTGSLAFKTNVPSGLTAADLIGNGSDRVEIRAGTPITRINNTLVNASGLVFTPAGVNDSLLSITAFDDGDGVSDVGTVSFTVNDKPIASANTTRFDMNEGQTLLVTGVSVRDEDDANVELAFDVLSALPGTVSLVTGFSGGLVASDIVGNNTSAVTVTVTTPYTRTNTTLGAAGLRFLAADGGDGAGPTFLEITPRDIGNAIGETRRIEIDINDKPTTTVVSDTFEVNEDDTVVISGLSVADDDDDQVVVELTVSAGTLQVTPGSGGVLPGQITGNNSALVTIDSSVARINTTFGLANGLIFTPDGVTDAVLDYTAIDDEGAAAAVEFITLLVNDKPVVNSASATFRVNESSTVGVTGVSVSDAENENDAVELVLTVDTGTLTLRTNVPGGLVASDISNNGTAAVTVNAYTSLTKINNTLSAANGLVYAAPDGGDGPGLPTALEMTAIDNGNLPLPNQGPTTVVTLDINDDPLITVGTSLFVVNEASSFNVSDLSVSDEDSTLVTMTLQTNAGGTLQLNTGVPGGVNAGQVTGNSSTQVTIRNATISAVNNTLDDNTGLLFSPSGNTDDQLTLDISDSRGAPGDTKTVDFIVNDLPIATATITSFVVNEGEVLNIAGLNVFDADDSNLTVTFSVNSGQLDLATTVPGGVSAGQVSPASGPSVTVLGTATFTETNTTLQDANGLNFTPDGVLNAALDVSATDDGEATGIISPSIIIVNINDKPVVTATIPAQTVNEGDYSPVLGLQVTDEDNIAVTVTLQSTSGMIRLNTGVTGGITAGQVVGNDSSNVTISNASLSAIANTFNHPTGVEFLAAGTTDATLTITAVDSGGAVSDPDEVVLTVNDKPVITVPAAEQIVNFNDVLVFSNGQGNAISVADVDSTNARVELSVPPGDGTLALATTAGLTVEGNTSNQVVFTGTLAAVNTALNGMSYTPTINDTTTLSVDATDDSGATALGKTVAIRINDPPDPDDQGVTITETTTPTFGIPTTLVPTHIVTVTANDPESDHTHTFAILSGDPNGDFSITQTGANTATIQTAKPLDFERMPSYSLTVIVTDTLSGTPLTGTATIAITVTDINEEPVLSVVSAAIYTEGSGEVPIDSTATVTDVDSLDFESGVLTVTLSGAGPFDSGNPLGTLSIADTGVLTEDLQGNTSTVFYNGVPIGNKRILTLSTSQTMTVTFTSTSATRDVVQLLLRATAYTNDGKATAGTRTISFQVDDGDSPNSLSAAVATAISFNAVNDPEEVTILQGGWPTLYEEMPVSIGQAITVTEVDANGQSVLVTVTVGNGTLAAVSDPGLCCDDTRQIAGGATIAAINTWLHDVDRLTYTSDIDFTGSDILTVTINDLGHTGGGSLLTTVTATLGIAPLNDAPIITVTNALIYTEDTGAQVVDGGATVTDVDSPDFATGRLTVTLHMTDTPDANNLLGALGIVATGGITETTSGSPSSVFFNGVDIGTKNVAASSMDATLTVEFNANATLAAVQALLRAIGYTNSGDDPQGTRSIEFQVNDGDGVTPGVGGANISNVTTTTVSFVNVNDPEIIEILPAGQWDPVFEEQAIDVGRYITVTEVDAREATVLITVSVQSGILSQSGMTWLTPVSGTQLVGTATITDINTGLHSTNGLSYTSDVDFTATDTLLIQVNDLGNTGTGPAQVVTQSTTIAVQAVNDAPVITVADTLLYDEGEGEVRIDMSATVTDVDSPDFAGGRLTVTLTGTNIALFFNPLGALSIRDSGGITETDNGDTSDVYYNDVLIGSKTITRETILVPFGPFSTTQTVAVTMTVDFANANATLDAAQVLLRALAYTYSGFSPSGERVIRAQLVDGDGTNNGGMDMSNLETTQVIITAINDPEEITIEPSNWGTVLEDTPLEIGRAITVTEVDANGNAVIFTMTVESGVFVSTNSSFVVGSGGRVVSGTANIAAINAWLHSDQITYTADLNFVGTETVTVTVNDLGHTGGGSLITTTSASFAVTAVNDAPVIVVTDTLPYQQGDGEVVIDAAASVTDVDSTDFSGGRLVVQLSKTSGSSGGQNPRGTLSITNTEGVTETSSGASSDVAYLGVIFGEKTIVEVGGANDNGSVTTLTVQFTNTNATVTAVQALMRSIAYEHAGNNPNGDRTITFQVFDGDGTANGGSEASNLTTTNVDFVQINDPEEITIDLSGLGTILEEETIEIGRAITVTEVDAGNANVRITLTVESGVFASGNSNYQVTNSGRTVSGQKAINSGGSNINGWLHSSDITYTGDLNFAGTDTLTVMLNDRGKTGTGPHQITTVSATLTIVPVNDPPTVTVQSTLVYTEDTGSLAVDATATFTDVDSTDLFGGRLTVRLSGTPGPNNPLGMLSIEDDGGITEDSNGPLSTVSFNTVAFGTKSIVSTSTASTLTVTFDTTDATVAAIQALLRTIGYANGGADPQGNRTIIFQVVDGDGSANGGSDTSNLTSTTVSFVNDNDPEEIVLRTADLPSIDEDTLVSIGQVISITNVDARGSSVAITFTVENGTLQRTGAGWLAGNGTNTLAGTRSIADINTFLHTPNALRYQGDQDFFGTETLTVTVNDLGATGGPAEIATAADTFAVQPINDPPVAADDSVSTDEDTPISGTLVVTDVDSTVLTYTITGGPTCVAAGPTPCGIASVTPSASWTYTPTTHTVDYMAVFTITVTDGGTIPDDARITVDVNADGIANLASSPDGSNTAQPLYTVTGQVVDAQGVGIEGASVTLTDVVRSAEVAGPEAQLFVLTDGDGVYQLQNIPAGAYRLTVKLAGEMKPAYEQTLAFGDKQVPDAKVLYLPSVRNGGLLDDQTPVEVPKRETAIPSELTYTIGEDRVVELDPIVIAERSTLNLPSVWR